MTSPTDIQVQKRFLTAFEPHRQSLWRFVRSMVRTHHDAEDIMSETILQAYQGFHRLRDEQAIVSYIFTIAHRIVTRSRWRRSRHDDYDEDYAVNIASTDLKPDELTDIELLRDALQRLPFKAREAVIMFDVLGFSLEEIRAVQGGTLSGVKSRLTRGRETLARLLDAEERMNRNTEPYHTELPTPRTAK